MDSFFSTSALYITLITLIAFCRGVSGATFTLINRCGYTVWPGILANAGSPALESTGFELPSGGSQSFQSPPNWSGRFWGRTGCTFDPVTGQGTCLTGDCGSNLIACNGQNAKPPATLAEFTIRSGTQDFYDVSLVDGYNLPMIVEPNGGSGTCLSTGCVTDLNQQCPNELRVGSGEACKSACEAFGTPEYCCSGAYATPDTCKPSIYSQMFKAACPRSYSYAYDDPTSTFTCTGADYVITFCPSLASQKSATPRDPSQTTTVTSTSTENGSGNGSGDDQTGDNISWLPNFFTGRSPKTIASSSYAWHFTLMASTVSFLFLYFLHS
ncbi:thaumatin-like protein 1 [Ricinus communis]|uniref:thaumatin-like protein 1 n=1 Tax=Ricinus communis TaxID=3988 RepID=UPI00201A82A7|nr:thaumatin-like protein 1 [Ricinus communis]